MSPLVTITLTWGGTVAAIVGTAALLGAIAYLIRLAVKGTRFVRRHVEAIHKVLDNELTHNHGSSIKDDVHGMAVALGTLQREFEEVRDDLYHHLAERTRKTP